MLLKDRVAVVTGPAKGMGAACTRLLAEHGADLALVGRDTKAIEEVQAECRAMGRRAEIFFCDLMDPASVDTMATSVLSAFGRCDALVLIAAVLLQAGKGGGLAASFGGASSSADSVIGTRQAGNLLTQASWWCGGIFLGLAFVLQLMSSRSTAPKSVLDQLAAPAAAPAAPAAPTQAAPPSPLTPSAPAAPATAPKP